MDRAEHREGSYQQRPITAAQLRMIFGMAGRHGLDEDQVRGYAVMLFGKNSMRDLSSDEGRRIIEYMKLVTGEIDENIPDRATEAQRRYILGLANKLGMNDRKQLRHFIRARFGVDDMNFLTVDKARKVIEGLKAMAARAERKKTEGK